MQQVHAAHRPDNELRANPPFCLEEAQGVGYTCPKLMRMKAIFVLALTCGFLSAAVGADEQLERSLNDQYRNKALYLRHSYKSGSQEYDADGQPLRGGEEGAWTLYGRIVVRKIAIGTDALRIDGNRATCGFDAKGMVPFEEHESVKIKIYLRAPVTSADQANAVLGRVFALSREDIVNSAPLYWQAILAKELAPHPTVDTPQNSLTGQKEPPPTFGDAKFFKMGEAGVTPPRILYKREPAFTDVARHHGFQGVVGLNALIDSTGRIKDVRLVHVIGMGLDESAIETVKTWRFAPATKDGVPVPVAVYIEVDYHLGERH